VYGKHILVWLGIAHIPARALHYGVRTSLPRKPHSEDVNSTACAVIDGIVRFSSTFYAALVFLFPMRIARSEGVTSVYMYTKHIPGSYFKAWRHIDLLVIR
jgi:hypothetical protein